MSPKRLLIFLVAYNAENNIGGVLQRIPPKIFQRTDLHTEVLVIDDSSSDATFATALQHELTGDIPVRVLVNPRNLGYGGNQKVGYHYALLHKFDYVALLHGDGQYAPERLPELLAPLLAGESDAVFGSRMLQRAGALRGGMPLYKFVGNIALTTIQNILSGATLSEWHSGYRVYATSILEKIPFDRNSNNFDFDTDIINQLLSVNARIREVPIPTFYGDEICHVNGISYGCRAILSCLQNRLQPLGLFYNRKFDVDDTTTSPYKPKFHFTSSHSLALAWAHQGERILILGDDAPDLISPFAAKGCEVVTLDVEHVTAPDVESALADKRFDKVLALDVIEHLTSLENFLDHLRSLPACRKADFLFTVPNIAFIPLRIMLLLGYFNYGKRGILDHTHTRLFTFSSMKRLCQQSGFEVTNTEGIPAPFPLALPDSPGIARVLLRLNRWAIRMWKAMFSYQILIEATPTPHLEDLLAAAERHAHSLKS